MNISCSQAQTHWPWPTLSNTRPVSPHAGQAAFLGTLVLSFQGIGLLTISHPSWWHSRAVEERGTRTQKEVIEETESVKIRRKVMEISQKA